MSRPRCLQLLLALALCALAACKGPAHGYRSEETDPDQRLAHLLELYEAGATETHPDRGHGVVDPHRVRNQIERLSLEFPTHVPTLVANAIIALDTHQPEKAQSYLDQVFRLQPVHPEAALVRARLSMEQGNHDAALRLLTRQARYSPSHAGLRETLAAVLVFSGDTEAALDQLEQAARLGAPLWRVQYHRGWIEERAGRMDSARTYYEHALELNPASREVAARIDGLRAALGESVR